MTTPILTTRQVTKRFGGLVAVDRLDIDVRERGIHSVIGPNGAGKTTLFNCITGFYHPEAGEMIFQGHHLERLTSDHVTRLGIARTYQNIRLFSNLTAIENILVGEHRHLKAGMAAAIVLGWFVITLRPSFGSILAAMAAGTAACGAWFVRNLVWTGNPFYPLLFGGPRWTAWDMAGWRADASAFTFDPFVLLASPWRLLNRPLDDGGISPLILTAAAAPVLWGSARNAVWALAGLFLLAWWATAPLTRYLSGALALACAAAAGTYAGRGMGAAAERWLGRLALAGAALSLACGFMSIQFGTEPLGAAIGKWSPDEYRNRRLAPDGFTGVLAGLERLVPRNGRACIMGHPFAYGLPRRAWSDFFYVHPPLYWWTLGARSGEEIAKRARQAGLTHIAWHPAGGRAFYGRNPGMLAWDERTLSAWVEFWRMHVRQADRIAQWRIFAVSRRALPPAPLPAPGVPGAEALTEPADRALERREFNAAERLAAGALALHPSIAPYLRDRIARARRGAGPPVDYGLE